MIKLPNGDLLFIEGEKIPVSLPSYYQQDSINKSHFRLVFEDCIHRKARGYIKPCGRPGTHYLCLLKSILVQPDICSQCEEIESEDTTG